MQRNVKIAIVVAQFNSEITEEMLKHALKRSSSLKASVTYVCRVPGSYDMPLIVQTLLMKNDVDAVVTLGAIVRGKTKHDEIIAHALAANLVELSLLYNKPVALGVAGPGMTWQQGEARMKSFARRTVDSAVKMVLRQRAVKKRIDNPVYPVVIG
jgi:6,7-dimethyl-8-ribityllumazine synthase